MTRPWRTHYTRERLLEAIDRFSFPDRFLFGTSTSGYQSEGGFNGPDEPKNNWYHVEADGSMETTGPGPRFWELYPEDLERAALLGCNGFRMGIEWSRVQPEADPARRKPPPFDASALDRYARILAGCRALGMEPAVTLFHFTHPLWLGMDPWLDRQCVMDPFVRYVEHAVRELNVRLVNEHGTAPVSYWITVNEPAMVPQASYLLKAHLFECLEARNRGVPLEAYFYWTLFDNYEWGSFAPRFGMLAVDYERGGRRSPLDAAGNNAAGAYRAMVEAFRTRDRDALKEAFLAQSYPLLFPAD